MANTTAKTKTTQETANVAKEFEVLFTANRKTLQDAFISGAEVAENAFKTSTEAFKSTYVKALKDGKSQVEKATQSLGDAPMYDKEGAESFIKVGNEVAEKSEKIGSEIIDFGSESVNAYFTATRSVIEADDAQKAFELQSQYARTSVETFISETSKLNAMLVDASKAMMEPFGSQYATNMDKFLNRS